MKGAAAGGKRGSEVRHYDSLFPSRRQYVRACNNISFEIFEVKPSVWWGVWLRQVDYRPCHHRPLSARYRQDLLRGIDLTALKGEHERRPLRRQMQMVFQNPTPR